MLLNHQKFVNKTLMTAANSNVNQFVEGSCSDDYNWVIRARKEFKQQTWINKSRLSPIKKDDTPKVAGTEKIKVLSVKREVKQLRKGPNGGFIEFNV